MCIRDSTQTYNEAPNKVQLFFWVELMYYLGFDAFRQVEMCIRDRYRSCFFPAGTL